MRGCGCAEEAGARREEREGTAIEGAEHDGWVGGYLQGFLCVRCGDDCCGEMMIIKYEVVTPWTRSENTK